MRDTYCICGQLVANDIERNEHILSHFEQKHCNGCAYDLIFVAGKWYQPHIDSRCNVKQEPDYDDEMNEDCDLINAVEPNVKDELIELSTPICGKIDDPLKGVDPVVMIAEPNEPLDEIYEDPGSEEEALNTDEDYSDNDSFDLSDSSGLSDEDYRPPTKRRATHILGETSKNLLSIPQILEELDKQAEAANDELNLKGAISDTISDVQSIGEENSVVSGPNEADKKMWQCGFCSKLYSKSFTAYKHLRDLHGSNNKTKAIPVPYKETQTAKANDCDVKTWQCGICYEFRQQKCNMYKHLRDEHGSDDKSMALPAPGITLKKQLVKDVKMWKCGFCSVLSKEKGNMIKHLRGKHASDDRAMAMPVMNEDEIPVRNCKMWKCGFCSWLSKQKENMVKHLRAKHASNDRAMIIPAPNARKVRSTEVEWKCRVCSLVTGKKQSIYKHLRVKHKSNDMKMAMPVPKATSVRDCGKQLCEIGLASLMTTQTTNLFMQTRKKRAPPPDEAKKPDSSVNMWKCGICSLITGQKQSIYRHLRVKHQTADKTLAIPAPNAARERISSNILWECRICTKMCVRKQILLTHIQVKHGSDDKALAIRVPNNIDGKRPDDAEMWSCGFCAYESEIKPRVVKHLRIMHGCGDKTIENMLQNHPNPRKHRFNCYLCRESFAFPHSLTKHMPTHPGVEYKCCIDGCEEQFDSDDLLLSHLKDHLQAVCKICHKSYTQLAHIVHKCQTEKKHVCDYCGKTFVDRYTLMIHVNMHTDNRPYACELCGKAYRRPASLSRHRHTHAGTKPLVCNAPNCDRAFIQHTDLYRHQFKAHGIFKKKYPCTICDQVFPENALLRKHTQNHAA